MLSRILRRAYLSALQSPRGYHTNQYEFDTDQDDPEIVLYFIHGLGGAPGQVNLLLPTIKSLLQRRFYLRAMHFPELDVRLPFAERYRPGTEVKIREKILQDLQELAKRYPGRKIIVTTSSHGMYDFVFAYPDIPTELRQRMVLCWLACASDEYDKLESRYHLLLRLFYFFAGYQHAGYKWSFGINHDRLTFLNPETSRTFSTTVGDGERVTYYKRDIEMRFGCLGLEWTDPTSVEFIKDYQQRQLANFQRITDIKCYVLGALRDGYWFDASPENMRKTISRYVTDYELSVADTSHLWCVTPPVVEPFLRAFFEQEA
jgi:hypothetical protein